MRVRDIFRRSDIYQFIPRERFYISVPDAVWTLSKDPDLRLLCARYTRGQVGSGMSTVIGIQDGREIGSLIFEIV